MCGENVFPQKCFFSTGGSPPRVRGKPEFMNAHQVEGRITPACAGKTVVIFGLEPPPEDHPRVCGENIPHQLRPACAGGSPPRVRGKRRSMTLRMWRAGITPACAGKTYEGIRHTDVEEDHPRVCGENFPRYSPARSP